MSRRSSLRDSILPGYLAIIMPLIALTAFAAPVHAGTGLQLSYDVAAKHDKRITTPATRTDPAIYAPLRLEYELITHVERMTETAQELHAVIDAMPGPSLPVDKTPPPPPVPYASTLDETLARLDHVAQLIADITRLIEAMPPAGGIALVNGRGSTATPSPPKPAIAALPVAPHPALPPQPVPVPEPDNPILTAAIRAVAVIGGGLVAAALGIYLRRWFMRKRPTRKQLATSIESPPLRDEALELADVMISMGLAEGASQALVERIRANPRQALSHWLKLLEIYRQSGNQAEFENAVEKIHVAFNVCPGNWDANENNSAPKSSLEDYPHIALQLENLWPTTSECEDYLLSLLADNRAGTRTGFPVSVVEEIILLLAVLHAMASGAGSEQLAGPQQPESTLSVS